MVTCPHCRRQMDETPELAGQRVACPHCSRQFVMPGAAPAPPPPPTPQIQVQPRQSVSTVSAGFRPREYPALRIITFILYGLAALAVLDFVLSMVLLYVGSFQEAIESYLKTGDSGISSAMILGSVLLALFSLLFHGMFIVAFLASAESIRIVIDIQRNTQETAFYAKRAVQTP